jgi:hypothetical protein
MSPGLRIVILYEDQRGPTKDFGLHKLVEACVFDVIHGERHLLGRALEGRPMKGDSQLLKSCREDVADISPGGHPVFAVFDNDKVRRLLKLPREADEETVVQAIKKGATAPDQLAIVLIEKNMESVVEAAGACDPSLGAGILDDALRKKNLAARDIVLKEPAKGGKRSVRDCILDKVPSLKRLIDQCASCLIQGAPSL